MITAERQKNKNKNKNKNKRNIQLTNNFLCIPKFLPTRAFCINFSGVESSSHWEISFA